MLQYLAKKHEIQPTSPKEAYECAWYFETEHEWKNKDGWGTGVIKDAATQEEIFKTITLQGNFMEALDK